MGSLTLTAIYKGVFSENHPVELKKKYYLCTQILFNIEISKYRYTDITK